MFRHLSREYAETVRFIFPISRRLTRIGSGIPLAAWLPERLYWAIMPFWRDGPSQISTS